MNSSKKFPNKIILGIVFLLLIGTSVFSYSKYIESVKLKKEKVTMIAKLVQSRDSITIIINDNSIIKNELLVEQQKISNLIDDLNQSNATIEELNQYKVEVVKLRKQVTALKNDKMMLVEKYEVLKNKQDSTVNILQNTVKSKEKLEELNTEMNRMVRKSSRVVFAGIKIQTFSRTKSGSAVLTDNANKVNFFKLSFVVIGNKFTTPIDKEYFVQIIDPKNNIIGQKLSKKFGPMILDYSYSSSFKFLDTNLDLTTGIDMANNPKGTYIVNVFDKDQIVLKSSFDLK